MGKKLTIKHLGIVREGQRIYYNNDLHKKQMALLEGKEFEETTKEKRISVSADTHGYYRGGIIGTCLESNKFAGWDENEIHDHFASMFLRKTFIKELNGREYTVQKILSTGDLDQKEMNDFIEKVVFWLTEKDIEILPSDNYQLNKYRAIK